LAILTKSFYIHVSEKVNEFSLKELLEMAIKADWCRGFL